MPGKSARYALHAALEMALSPDEPVTRKYWQIETGLHYRRDVTFHEDATRMSHPHATRNLATVHNIILSLFARLDLHNVAQTRRFFDADPKRAFSLLLSAHPGL